MSRKATYLSSSETIQGGSGVQVLKNADPETIAPPATPHPIDAGDHTRSRSDSARMA